MKLKIKIDTPLGELFYQKNIIGVTNMVNMGELHVSTLGI